jgi:hypothetical protein
MTGERGGKPCAQSVRCKANGAVALLLVGATLA